MSYQEKYLKYKNKYLALKAASLEQNNNYENNIIEKIENELNISNLNSIPQYAGGFFDDDSDDDLIDLGRLSQSEIQFGGDNCNKKQVAPKTDDDLGLPDELPALDSETEVAPTDDTNKEVVVDDTNKEVVVDDTNKEVVVDTSGDMLGGGNCGVEVEYGLPDALPILTEDEDSEGEEKEKDVVEAPKNMMGGNLDDDDSLSDSDSSLKISDSESSDSESD